jgi:hypothetical protein
MLIASFPPFYPHLLYLLLYLKLFLKVTRKGGDSNGETLFNHDNRIQGDPSLNSSSPLFINSSI